MITQESWYIQQTDRILTGDQSKISEYGKEDSKYYNKLLENNISEKHTWVKEITEKYGITDDIEDEISEKVKEFAYSDINPYKSERIERRISKELRQIEINERIAKENKKTHIFWLFRYLFGNENKDIVKKYKKEERERIKRVRVFKDREAKRIKDCTPIKEYDYTVSTAKLREDRNIGANHNTPKRTLKQIDIKDLQLKALKKVHKILRELKKKGAKENFLKSITIFAGEVISESDPYELTSIISDLQKDAFGSERKETIENENEKLLRYMDYSNRLENLRSYGISYKNLIAKDKREVKEMRKLKEIGSEI